MTAGDPLPIERLRITIVAAPITGVVDMAFGQLKDRRVCLVEVEAGGVTGLGESWINYPSWAHSERVATFSEGVAPLLLGGDASDPGAVLRLLTERLLPVGRQAGGIGPIWQAISGIDIALWDLAGKVAGQPVHRLLGGTAAAPTVPAYASGIGPTDVEQLCAVAMADGYRAVKTKLGFGTERDERTLSTTRSCIGADVELFADANQAWDVRAALETMPMLAAHDVRWLEEPLSGDRIEDLQKLAADGVLPLATGENIYGIDAFEACVDSSAVALVQPDLAKSGGFTVGRAVAEYAASAGLRVAPHCYSSAVGVAASAHLAAAYDHVDWVEIDVRPNPLRTDLLTTPLGWGGGALSVPEAPGLGVELDPETVARFRVYQEERSIHDR
ncbi:mandelate racemase/muconate lactonizing enzyme family protein [Phytoactinopolyspora halotolerans]|uniref:Mandelate racemase/muconate lactonizing enzyme family protein n=1 Tax=Phytoactinopolyspora halotolerans TaxID=1981512 RepID=A0A6L9SD65_9ACTN|nr:mandelate racemase/muconate lactonizing enzyme family protein [Phytoactinopolyspora halotolerans]NEE02502.1 mandelate racemase/muconate lactonizing enzyme family protein [Phytoactinopolyspora halotolerans]